MRLAARRVLAIACFAAFVPAVAFAGTLCGTVTDRVTSAPIPYAGIFLRTPAGAYTGINGASDATGAFCIANVAAGTYDIEVRVDDYQVAYVRGVVVTSSTTGVDIGSTMPRLRLAAPAPNPARDATQLSWTLSTSGRVKLAIYDARGRLVRGWSDDQTAGAHALQWNLRDSNGRGVAPGAYFVRLDAGGAHQVRLLLRTR